MLLYNKIYIIFYQKFMIHYQDNNHLEHLESELEETNNLIQSLTQHTQHDIIELLQDNYKKSLIWENTYSLSDTEIVWLNKKTREYMNSQLFNQISKNETAQWERKEKTPSKVMDKETLRLLYMMVYNKFFLENIMSRQHSKNEKYDNVVELKIESK